MIYLTNMINLITWRLITFNKNEQSYLSNKIQNTINTFIANLSYIIKKLHFYIVCYCLVHKTEYKIIK